MRYRQRTSKAVSAWISDSDYTHGGEVVCGLRHVYRGVWGCPAWAAGQPCSYCFLKGTVRGKTELLEGVAWIDCDCSDHRPKEWACDGGDCLGLTIDNARAAVEKWLGQPGEPYCGNRGDCDKPRFDPLGDECLTCDDIGHTPMLLNAGEYTDSLAWTPEENPHIGMLLDLFSDPETNPHGQKLLLVSKAGLEATEAHLEGRTPSENVILSWSVGNAGVLAEPHWAGAMDRLFAAWSIADRWCMRLRLDPLVEGIGDVGHFAADVAESGGSAAELITLGTLRHNGGRVKHPADERVSIYRSAIDGLRAGGYEGDIGLCKESKYVIRTVLGIEPNDMRCNCLP